MSSPSLKETALNELERLIVEKMPITEHLEFELAADDQGRLRASATQQPNTKHMGSAFGGSLSMLATETGWAMMHQLVQEAMHDAMEDMRHRVEVMIQESDIEYLRPVYENISVVCEPPDEDAQERFQEMLDRWGRARLELECKINEAGERAVTFIGQYVALAQREEGGDGATAASFHMENCGAGSAHE
jgi:thioesterase domain-containing protein